MKSAIVSGIILICLVVFIIANSFLCVGIINDLQKSLSSDTSLTVDGVEAFEKKWKKHDTFLHLGVNSRYIDSISESIVELKSALKTKSEQDVSRSLDILYFRLSELEKLNKFNFSNVF